MLEKIDKVIDKVSKKFFKREITRQSITFVLLGGFNLITNYIVFLLLFYVLSVYYLVSSALGYIAGMTVGFFLNRKYTFKSAKAFKKGFPLYFFVYIFSMFLGLGIIRILVDYLTMEPFKAQLVIIGITTVTNFFGTKYIVFQNKEW